MQINKQQNAKNLHFYGNPICQRSLLPRFYRPEAGWYYNCFRQKHIKPLVVCSPMGLCIFVCLIVPVSKLPCRSIVQIYTPCGVQTPSAINLKNNLIIYHFSIYNFLIYCPQITQTKQIFFFLVRQKLSKMIQQLFILFVHKLTKLIKYSLIIIH